MELSKEILSFLHWLDMQGLPFEAAFLKDIIPGPDEMDEQQLRENIKTYLLTNKIVSKYVKAKSEPIFESVDAIEKLLAELSEISDEDLINTYLTKVCLAKKRRKGQVPTFNKKVF
jgi:hypothetical protein